MLSGFKKKEGAGFMSNEVIVSNPGDGVMHDY
ncbi:hypothetical protein RSal33209_3042 [Renibacterium salmoninarum ATCC 33209]|uniref:Uncharacterized protein n=1 Tax=Renibacterium salmoninarum (strain ATCC 33209 / DSM 20767 / JCM 11484 / NBRC 15589 / NCIMB 2235) TaxID=288705 RepID=A9WU92_RENSM|nr:hypothetical protein RSal33209_3042 [Renibacterium salmoninarum ATCC 33209]